MDHKRQRLSDLLAEKASRDSETLALYEPLPFQDRFHRCRAHQAIIVKGNRAGGSLCGFIEDARLVLNRDPYQKINSLSGVKTLVLLGYGEKHIGNVMHKMLFREGGTGMRLIRDEHTKRWRVWKKWQPYDAAYAEKTRPAPPLIPDRFIKPNSWAWEDKRQYIFSHVELTTGWEIKAYSTNGEPKHYQGFDAHWVHVDEDMQHAGWHEESLARMMNVAGRLRWTAMPHDDACDVLPTLIKLGDEQAGLPEEKRTIDIIRASAFDNPWLDKTELERNVTVWKAKGEDVFLKRVYGELCYAKVKCYPSFDEAIHVCDPFDIPADWCRLISIDPGHAKAGVVFFAIPPSGRNIFVYDEFRPVHASADIVASGIREKTPPGVVYSHFLIDGRGSRVGQAGDGKTIRDHYYQAFVRHGLSSQSSGHDFWIGSDDIEARQEAVRQWLAPDPSTGKPKLQIFRSCQQTIKEIKELRKARTATGRTKDKPDYRGESECVVNVEYMAAFDPKYRPPGPPKGGIVERLREKQRRNRQHLDGVYFS